MHRKINSTQCNTLGGFQPLAWIATERLIIFKSMNETIISGKRQRGVSRRDNKILSRRILACLQRDYENKEDKQKSTVGLKNDFHWIFIKNKTRFACKFEFGKDIKNSNKTTS